MIERLGAGGSKEVRCDCGAIAHVAASGMMTSGGDDRCTEGHQDGVAMCPNMLKARKAAKRPPKRKAPAR
jgi:hypothetical protein